MATPRVTALIPVYNGAPYLAEAIRSVLDQTYRDVEILVVDDGSTDDSAAIAEAFGPPVRVIRCEQNGGASRARNRGVAEARGEYIVNCDSDDVQLAHRFETLVRLLDANPQVALACSEFSTYDGSRVTKRFHLRDLRMGPRRRALEVELEAHLGRPRTCAELGLPVPEEDRQQGVYQGQGAALMCLFHFAWAGACIYRRQVVLDHGGYDADLTTYEDWALNGRIGKQHEVIFVNAPLFLYRMHESQLHVRFSTSTATTYHDVLDRVWLRDPAFCARHPELVRTVHAHAQLKLGHYHADRNEWAQARNHFLRSVMLRPRQRGAYKMLLRAALKSLASRG
jgi:glycosyltransferase involved in cell wall biosynthesis